MQRPLGARGELWQTLFRRPDAGGSGFPWIGLFLPLIRYKQ
jgi:hypothetical protein